MKWIAPHGATTPTERYVNAQPTIAGSNPDAAFFNTVLDELLAVIVAADMTPTDANLHQIADAIVYLTERAATSGVTKGSYWFGKTTANFTVPNPTLPEQNYIDFTTLNTYSAKSDLSGWTQTGTFVPPAGIDFTILITSKFWDIPEQDDQQGGWAQYNHTDDEWSWWPKIINLDNAANISLSNLNTNGKNIANWSSNVANCITNIPQDIKLELNNGTLTLKAGSKVYVPNGPGVFNVVTIPNDINAAFSGSGTTFFLFWSEEYSSYITGYLNGICHSGTSVPANYSGLFFDTTSNTVDMYQDGIAQGRRYSLPLGRVELSANGTITKIEYIFNGFGYIGSTVFALPGVKGLIPDGRNADGSLKNIEFTVNNVAIKSTDQRGNDTGFFNIAGEISLWDTDSLFTDYYPTPATGKWWMVYDTKKNAYFQSNDGGAYFETRTATFGDWRKGGGNKIISFTPKTVFHAVDNNEILFKLYPVGSLYFGTQDTCPMALLMPGTLWSRVAQKIVVVTPYDTPIPVTTSSTDTLSGAHEPLRMKRAADGNNPSKNLLAVYGDKSVYGIGGTVAEPGPRMYPSNLIADVSNSAVTTNVWRRTA